MKNINILKLIKEYALLKKEKQNLQIELAQLKDQENAKIQKIEIKKALSQASKQNLFLADQSYDRIEQLNQQITNIDKLCKKTNYNLSDIEYLINEVSNIIGAENLPSIDDIVLLNKSKLEKSRSKKAKIFNTICASVFVFFQVSNIAFGGGLFGIVILIPMTIFLIAMSTLFSLINSYNSRVQNPFNKRYKEYLEKLNDTSQTYDWLINLKTKLLYEIEIEKSDILSTIKPNMLLPTDEKFTLDNYYHYRKTEEPVNLESDVKELRRHIENKNNKISLVEKKIINIKKSILIEFSNLSNPKEKQDILEEIKEADTDLYEKIVEENELRSDFVINNKNESEEKGKTLVKKQNRKIM